MKIFTKYSFFILVVFLISVPIIEISYGQITITETKSETSITSSLDALFKAPLLVSQTFVVGVSFIHSFLFIYNIKREHISVKNNHNNFFLSFLFDNKLFLVIIMVCGVIILTMSTILIVFQAYILSFDLGIGLLSTFEILISSSVGNIFITKVISSLCIIALVILYQIINKRFQNQILKTSKLNQQQQEQNYISEKLRNKNISLIFCITILVLGSINILSNSIQSHNAAVDFFPTLAIAADWIHFMMVSIWVGGLFYISLVISQKLFLKENLLFDHHYQHQIQPSINNSKDNVKIQFILLTLLRFSIIAVISISIIFITGLYMAVLHLQQPYSLIDSPYGNILIFKLLIVSSMTLLGTYHHLQIPKLIKQYNKNLQLNQLQYLKKFNITLKIEYILGIVIIFISSFLTITDPPHHESHMDMPEMNHAEDAFIQHSTNNDNQRNDILNKAFPLIAFTISILISIIMILLIKRIWTNLKLYNVNK